MNSDKPAPTPRSPILAGVLSLLLPGLGQVYQRDFSRGVAIFFTLATALSSVVWYGKGAWWLVVAALWIWNIWDAFRLPKGASVMLAALLWFAIAYGIGWQVTQTDFISLFKNRARAESILQPMLDPDFVQQRSEKRQISVQVQMPCSATPPIPTASANGLTIAVTPDCATVNAPVEISGTGFWANYDTELIWYTPIGSVAKNYQGKADANGNVVFQIDAPYEAMTAAIDTTLPQLHRVALVQKRPLQGIEISTNGKYILQGIYETLALALLATILGAIFAIPMGFLAARNLMGGNPVTLAIYYVIRTILNIIRSVESLIWAIIFVVIVGLGPFPGMLAIMVHTTAALGKLYSEVIEGIDPGPIEAIRATGGNWLQIVRFGVIPQIIPPFTALTIFRWDINVRSSTIIGFVGGGGIGFFLYQWILLGDYRAVSSCFIAIAVVVVILDFFSAKLRERLV
ncbi:MAG: phosphonate ABC transporter, permease protein PhnE [Anaerolineaceae bacterium]